MKREECAIGAEVYTDDGINYRYVVTELPDEDDVVRVKATDESFGEMDDFHLDDLHLYDPEKIKKVAAGYQARIDTAKNAFEAAFAALGDMRDEYQDGIGLFTLEEAGLISTKELDGVIESGGWSSSSLWC